MELKEIEKVLSELAESITRIRVAERNGEFERKVQQHLDETYAKFVEWVKEKEYQEMADGAREEWLESQCEEE